MSGTIISSSRWLDFHLNGSWESQMQNNFCRSATAAFLGMVCLSTLSAAEPDRSPVDLVLGPKDAWLATVNQTSDSVSLVRTSDGRVLDEVSVGHHPVGITLAP